MCLLLPVDSFSMLISIPALSDDGVGDQAPAPLLLLVFFPSAAASLLDGAALSCKCCCLSSVGAAATPARTAAGAFSFKTSTIELWWS